MRRGTTPTHTFEIPFNVGVIEQIKIIYLQNNEVKLTKAKGDCKLDGTKISVTLTQEETLKFANGENVKIQLRILTQGDDALASEIISIPVGVLLDDEVIK